MHAHVMGNACSARRRVRTLRASGLELVGARDKATKRVLDELETEGLLGFTGCTHALSRWKPGTKGRAGDHVRELWMFPWAATLVRALLRYSAPWDAQRAQLRAAVMQCVVLDDFDDRLEMAQRIVTTWALASMAP